MPPAQGVPARVDPARLHDLACAVHLHSNYSDGTATIPELMEDARDAERDVVLLTDHDTLGARDDGHEGWHGSVLLGVGLEVTPRAGHFLAFGIEKKIKHKGVPEAEIPVAVAKAGGFGFAAHPFSKGARILERYGFAVKRGLPHGWTDLEGEGLAGMELWSLTTDASEDWRGPVDAIRYMWNPEGQLDGPRPHDIAAWDGLCQTRRFVAIGGLDAHQHGIRVRDRLWSPMPNARYFRMLSTYVSLPEAPQGGEAGQEDLGLVYDALREGRCYLSVDTFAPGRGFRFWGESGDEVVVMGEERPAGGWTLRASLPAMAEVTLLRNGSPVAQVSGTDLEHKVAESGSYRLEARRHWRGRERPWIISNPIYLR
ncbi:MAG: CehA/McbA family metallohydrolase [Actinomycetota bacterium]|nr:CehA/McbA family metallohydrolase [Actinomycetota bacterium]